MARRHDKSEEIDADVMRDARLAAVYRDTSVAELLTEILRPALARILEDEQAKHAKRGRAALWKGG